MAKINFPDTSIDNPNTSAPWADGDTVNITADGVTITYEFKKPASPNTDSWWKSMGRVNNATPLDKIEEGNTSAEVIDTGTDGQFVVSTEGAARMKVTSDGTVKLNGSNIDTDPSIQLNPDGSAVFDEDVVIGDTTGEFIRLRVGSQTDINLKSDDANAATFWQYYNGTSPGDITYIVRSSGDVEIGGSLDLTESSSTPNISLNADGSGSFSGTVNTGEWPNNLSTSTGGGAYLARNDTDTSVVWKAFNGGSTNANITSQINADGAASFAGTVERKQTTIGHIPDTDGLTYGETISHAYNATNYRFAKAGWEYNNVGDRNVTWNIFDTKSLPKATDPDSITNWNPQISFGTAGLITLHGTNKGIQFGSTNSAGDITSQTLDDYEEGTFTPSIAFNGNAAGVTYSTRTSSYTKIGRSVTITLQLFVSNKGSSTGDLEIIGLPFAPRNTEVVAPVGAYSFTPTAGLGSPCLVLLGTTMKLSGTDNAVGSYYTDTAFGTGFQLRGTFCYETDA